MLDRVKKIKIGQKVELPQGKWEEIKHIYDDVQKFCSSKENKKNMQFQINLKQAGNRSISPTTKDIFEIERIR